MTAYDAVAAGHTGLPWPDIHDAGAVSLLQTLRTAAGRAVTGTPSIRVALPVPGDVRGLAPGTQFERDALAAGEVDRAGSRSYARADLPVRADRNDRISAYRETLHHAARAILGVDAAVQKDEIG